ncbi:MAG: carboxyvinyl-carboxyphosphonate phosphorylmutase [Deltaproteobacteria bacterium]|nr:carboxyvinyl-carboxyphosphonate phosphorylmutase [Deltaproteobacteria bacterium]
MTDSRLHPLISDSRIFLAAGVWDPLSAKLAERAGFRSVVLSGYAVAAAHLGEPDFGLLTQSEVLDVARRVCRAVDIPVVVDGDTGFGGALNVIRMVEELVAMGARGVILEDQRWPKRCGHMRGKTVVPMEEHVQKIRAAVDAKGDAPFMITARTDARAPLGLDEAIRRARAYHEAGAQVLFVEAPETVEEMARIAREVPGLQVANMIEGGRTPILPLDTLHEMGFHNVGYVLTGLFAAAHAMDRAFTHLLQHGSSKGLEGDLMTFDELTGLLGLEEKYALDEHYGEDSEQS